MLEPVYSKERSAGAPALGMSESAWRGSPSRQVYREQLILTDDLSQSLRALARSEQEPLRLILLSTFFALVSRHGGQKNVCIGALFGPAELNPAAPHNSLSLNALPVEVSLENLPSFRELWRRVEAAMRESEARQVQPFQAMFVWSDSASSWVHDENRHCPLNDFGICLFADDRANPISITMEFDNQLYSAESVRRILAHYRSLLAATTNNPEQQPSAIDFLTERDREQVLIEWNNTARLYQGGLVHQLFEKQVQATPQATAIVCGDQRVSFSELDRKSNQVAQYLMSRSIGPRMRVGICLRRSVEMVAAMFGVLKAGASYLPLDPEYPPERLHFMMEDAALAIVITAQSVDVPLPPGIPALKMDASEVQALLEDLGIQEPAPLPRLEPDDPAYIIYTSGSTGKPKGVIIRHEEFMNYLSWALELYECDQGVGAPINTSFGFDATITSLYLPLISGRPVFLLPEDRQLEALAELLASGAELTLVKLTPAHLEALRALLGSKAAAIRARCFVVGGEAFPRHLATFWREQCPSLRIFNEYGPTETVVGCCVYELGPEIDSQGDVPIGRPTPNTRLYVLDDVRELAPIGVTGELYIGGGQVGAGYLNRPELTAERFLPDPYAISRGGRMYRTGDLVRWRSSGILEFLGRADDQVKIRGFRVELGEIETTLSQHPAVQSAAVALREMGSGERQLVGYFVPKPNAGVSVESIRHFLSEHLPDHMVPQSFVSLGNIPLTPNGKVDRRALPMPDQHHTVRSSGLVTPNSPKQLKIAAIWRDVLKIQTISINDNFFELGGTSLLAVRILSRLRSTFRINLPLSSLLAAPTIAQLAELVEGAESASAPQSCIVPIQPEGSRPPIFCVHGIGGNVLSYYALAKSLGNDQPVYGIQARGLDGKSAPFYSLPDMAGHYIREIRQIRPEGPYYLAGLSLGGLITLEIAHQLSDSGEQVALLAMFDTFPPGMLPGSSASRWNARLQKTARRIQLHARNIWQSGSGELIPYLRARLKTIRRRSRSRFLQAQYELTQRFDGSIPQAFRDVREAGAAAARNYVPRQYTGPCVYFQAENSPVFDGDERRAMWAQYIPGLIVAPVPSDHLAILDEPAVKVVADKLKSWMDQTVPMKSAAGASR